MANKNLIWCDKALLENDLSGKTYVITGSNSGVGLETTRQLVKQGGHVIMACRRPDAAAEVAKEFEGLAGTVDILRCDLADLDSVRAFAKAFHAKYEVIDGLMCNAGMVNMDSKPAFTKDGFELTIGISYFGHFLLTELLLEALKKSPDGRYGILSSVVHAGSPKNRYQVHLDDLNFERRDYSNFGAYGEAKVATTLYALELADRLQGSNVTTASIHPGWARSNFGQGGPALMRVAMFLMKPILPFVSDSSWESAQTSMHVLLSEDARNHSGAYFSQHSVLYQDKECRKGGWPMETPNPHARDLKAAKALVAKSRELVGLS